MKEKDQETKKERIRAEYAPKGQRNQISMTFRLDKDLIDWVKSQPNQGRYINELIRVDIESRG